MSDAPLLHTGVRAVQSVNLLLAFDYLFQYFKAAKRGAPLIPL